MSLSAPRQDLELLQKLVDYQNKNEAVSNAALKSFVHPLWYSSEDLTGLVFFDDGVSEECKVQMVAALSRNGDDHPDKRIYLEKFDVSAKQLSHFVTANTRETFVTLELSQEFLRLHLSMWRSCDNYNVVQTRVLALQVVNDAAERGVSLIQAFNPILTNQEKQFYCK